MKAVDYLLNVNRGYRMDLGRRVVVIGGGFVAFDAARTALRVAQGGRVGRAGEPDEADARMKEALDSARAALRGGATRRDDRLARELRRDARPEDDAGTRGVRGGEAGRNRFRSRAAARSASSARAASRPSSSKRVLSVFDENGRFAPAYDEARSTTLEADACILAIGQKPDLSFLKPEDGVALTPGGTIRVDPETLATSAPGVFAGGDVAFGPRNLIEAVANGKRAARSIHEHLSREAAADFEPLSRSRRSRRRDYRMIAGFELFDREAPPTLDVGRRTGIAEVESGYGDEEARRAGGALPRLPRPDDLRPGEVRPLQPLRGHLPRVLPGDRPLRGARSPGRRARGALAAARGEERAAALGDGQGRRPLHPLRPLRHPLPDRRDDDGEVHDHGTVRRGRGGVRRQLRRESDGRRDRRPAGGSSSSSSASAAASRRSPRQAVASLRSLVPNVSYDAPTTVKVGHADGLSRTG